MLRHSNDGILLPNFNWSLSMYLEFGVAPFQPSKRREKLDQTFRYIPIKSASIVIYDQCLLTVEYSFDVIVRTGFWQANTNAQI